MLVTEARLAANRANSLKSCGPKTPEGKEISRRNGLKHGLAGSGVVVAEADSEEIERRVEALEADLRPRSPVGSMTIRKLATLSVRSERAFEHESAAIASRVRHACDDFDEARVDEADRLLETLGDDPRKNLRRLKKTPEGVDRLVEAWLDLGDAIARNVPSAWTDRHLDRLAHLTGLKSDQAHDSQIGSLGRAAGGDFLGLGASEGGGLDDQGRRDWARFRLLERIEAEVDALTAHRETLDFELIEIDRAEAPARALFDPSKPATLARRYESEANRGFFKALDQYRKAEAESAERLEATPALPPSPSSPSKTSISAGMGSLWEPNPPADRSPTRPVEATASSDFSIARGPDGRHDCIAQPPKAPG